MSTPLRSSLVLAALLLVGPVLVGSAVGCAPANPDGENLVGADETTASTEEGLSGNVAVGSSLVTTAGVNLRSGPATNRSVLHVIPEGSTVIVQRADPSSGFYRVKHNGTIGWTFGAYLELAAGSGDGDDDGSQEQDGAPSGGGPRGDAITRAKATVGFSYWWGHGRFRSDGATSSTRGSCSGSCPDCSHSGQYGGDCSGLVAKVWQVPSSNTSLSTDSHPYNTSNFLNDATQWSRISRGNVAKADAMVYREGGAGHIFVYEKGDGWGSMFAYECKGCAAGCISGYRTASSAYKAIRRSGW